MQKSFVRGTWQVKRAFSPCVIIQGGGRTIYIAGHTGQADDSGKSLAGDFDAQFKQTFRNIEAALQKAGSSLKDAVRTTYYVVNAADWPKVYPVFKEFLAESLPASTAIICGLVDPRMKIEIEVTARKRR